MVAALSLGCRVAGPAGRTRRVGTAVRQGVSVSVAESPSARYAFSSAVRRVASVANKADTPLVRLSCKSERPWAVVDRAAFALRPVLVVAGTARRPSRLLLSYGNSAFVSLQRFAAT